MAAVQYSTVQYSTVQCSTVQYLEMEDRWQHTDRRSSASWPTQLSE